MTHPGYWAELARSALGALLSTCLLLGCGSGGESEGAGGSAGAGAGGAGGAGAGGAGGGGTGGAGAGGQPPQAELNPTLFDFEIRDPEGDRIYFQSSEPISASTVTGFAIPDHEITGVTIHAGQTTDHYFTLSGDFDWWDNVLIRYDGGSDMQDVTGDPLYPFTLEYVENLMAEPPAPDSVYVDAVGSNGNGTPGSPYNNLQDAFNAASAGTTIWVKAGDYGDEKPSLPVSGTPSAPIKIIGYRNQIGDDPVLDRQALFDGDETLAQPSTLPMLQGSGSGDGIVLAGRDNVIFKNFIIHDMGTGSGQKCIEATNTTNLHVENVYLEDAFYGIQNGSDAGEENRRMVGGYVANMTGGSARIDGHKGMYRGVWAVTTRDVGQDYYLTFYGADGPAKGWNIAIENFVYRFLDDSHGGHGISFKAGDTEANGRYLRHSLAADNVIVNGENGSIEFRHSAVRYCVAKRNDIYFERDYAGEAYVGPSFENGAQDNIVELNRIDGAEFGIGFYEGDEDGQSDQGLHNNTVRNNLFLNCQGAVGFGDWYAGTGPGIGLSTGNRFTNNTVYNCEYLLNNQSQTDYAMDETNVFANNIFYEVGAYRRSGRTSDVTVSTSNLFNSFEWSGAGADNVSIDPDFVDLVDFVPQASGLDGAVQAEYHYDYDGDQRTGYTMGAQERTD